jgi:large subunit ribosomal protein L13
MAKSNIKTKSISVDQISEKWYLIDAAGARLGQVATLAAQLLLGKHDPMTRDYLTPKTKVVITNSDKLDITERKALGKTHTRYSGYPDGLTVTTLGEQMAKDSTKVVELAVRRMLPKNIRGRKIFNTNFYVYAGSEHKHVAQNPQVLNIKETKI